MFQFLLHFHVPTSQDLGLRLFHLQISRIWSTKVNRINNQSWRLNGNQWDIERVEYLVHWMQRVMTVLTKGPRFLSTTDLFVSVNRPLSDPKAMDWSWRSHSPPWSQIGQSSGWFIRRNSITPSRAFFAIGVSVLIFIPVIRTLYVLGNAGLNIGEFDVVHY